MTEHDERQRPTCREPLPAGARSAVPGPSENERRCLLWIAWAGGIGLLLSFLSWGHVRRSWPMSGERTRVDFDAWSPATFHMFGAEFPMWIFSLVAAGLGGVAALQLAGRVRLSWKVYSLTASVSALAVIGWCVAMWFSGPPDPPRSAIFSTFSRLPRIEGAWPGLGAYLTACVFLVVASHGIKLRCGVGASTASRDSADALPRAQDLTRLLDDEAETNGRAEP